MHCRSRLGCLVLLLVAQLGLAHGLDRKTRVLVLDSFSHHDWQQTTELLPELLKPTDLFELDVSTAPEKTNLPRWPAWHPQFSNHEVLLQPCNGINQGPTRPERVKSNFVDFVHRGDGFYIFHSAQNAFLGWHEYEQLMGLCWRQANYGTSLRVNEDGAVVRIRAGEGRDTGHGQRGPVLVTRWGDVQPAVLGCAAVQTILPRAIQWPAGRPFTFPIRNDFPDSKHASLRPPKSQETNHPLNHPTP